MHLGMDPYIKTQQDIRNTASGSEFLKILTQQDVITQHLGIDPYMLTQQEVITQHLGINPYIKTQQEVNNTCIWVWILIC